MKTLYMLMTAILLSLPSWGQNGSTAGSGTAQDVVVTTDGREMKGKVTKVTAADISFVYAGETAEYVLKKSEIQKIVHSSGRVENFNASPLSQARQTEPVHMTASPNDHHNKIAILPFVFLIDRQAGPDEMGYKAQNDAYSFLSKHAAGYTILDTRTTNAKLLKAGITRDKMMAFTMKEICDLLGVEYVIDGTVTQNKGALVTSTTNTANATIKRSGSQQKATGVKANDYSFTDTEQKYEVNVALSIFMDNNATIFQQDHTAFLAKTDASYESPLQYLLKRSPLYRK